MGYYISNDIRMFFVGGISLGGVLVGLESRDISSGVLLLANYGLLHKEGDAGIWKRSLTCEGGGFLYLWLYICFLLGDKFSR